MTFFIYFKNVLITPEVCILLTLDTVCGRVDPIWLCVNREWDLRSGGLGRSKDDGCRGIMAVA